MWEFIWSWLLSHAPQAVTLASGVKTIADAAESVKKLAPARLESKEITQEFIETSVTMLDDPTKTIEEKRWEVETRKELVGSLVRTTTVEAAYNIARYAIFTTFTAFLFHLLVKMVTRPRAQNAPAALK